ncbi:hypothetical protein COT94_00505 [Candidatus Falkowbacteria bacterium CG10_big_fil_rev_8_21_14_0_10_37_14]|uniref:Uncharacterized protein n=1 Tax=Candidatus Falkowbacteria bacterium CG10_big_fil_rev_8_21_14_0_10_37_14 TaxID=1974561 RepID=A0A2M6WUF6_9BACT|nr:hypothetical protein [Candidatus Falkowbacteria bacterium]PIT96429.1 MAG: hypothetical protein COT94_00505 [Candidatus Falkowbacteria bacterium CG10_big_fil_rev_8_21_14_0_10_37_14]
MVMLNKYLKTYTLILWWLLATLIVVILWSLVVPLGRAVYIWRPFDTHQRFGTWRPLERISSLTTDGYQLIGSPVYVPIFASRPFNKLHLTIRYRLNDAGSLAVGVLQDRQLWRYETRNIDNRWLSELISSKIWGVLEKESLLLLQREEHYSSVEDFLANPPTEGSVAVYNYEWTKPFFIKNYQAKTDWHKISGLKGSWTAETYLKNEVAVLDLTTKASTVDAQIKLSLRSSDGKLVKEYTLNDFVKIDNSLKLAARIDKLPEGLYRWDWIGGDKTIIDELATQQQKLAFLSSVQITRGTTLWLSGSHLALSTGLPESLGEFSIDKDSLVVDKIYQNFVYKGDCQKTVCRFNLSKGGYKVGLNGRLTFWIDGLVGPVVRQLDASIMNDQRIKYIIADYQRPLVEAESRVVEVDFDLKSSLRDQGNYELMLSWNGEGTPPQISEIKAEFTGAGLKDLIKKLWPK